MGLTSLPVGGTVYIDAQIAIYTVEIFPAYTTVLHPMWAQADAGDLTVISSELTLMETLVLPLRNAEARLVSDFTSLWHQPHVNLLPITMDVLTEAARLRAAHRALKTPDAIHAATALLHGCSLFVTNDRGFLRVPGLPLAVLDDIIAGP